MIHVIWMSLAVTLTKRLHWSERSFSIEGLKGSFYTADWPLGQFQTRDNSFNVWLQEPGSHCTAPHSADFTECFWIWASSKACSGVSAHLPSSSWPKSQRLGSSSKTRLSPLLHVVVVVVVCCCHCFDTVRTLTSKKKEKRNSTSPKSLSFTNIISSRCAGY